MKYAIVGEMDFEDYYKIVSALEPNVRTKEHEKTTYSENYTEKQLNKFPWIKEEYGGCVLFPDDKGDYFWWIHGWDQKSIKEAINQCKLIKVEDFKKELPEYFI